MNRGRVSFNETIPYVDCAYPKFRVVACFSTGMEEVDTAKVVFVIRVTVRTEKIPA